MVCKKVTQTFKNSVEFVENKATNHGMDIFCFNESLQKCLTGSYYLLTRLNGVVKLSHPCQPERFVYQQWKGLWVAADLPGNSVVLGNVCMPRTT